MRVSPDGKRIALRKFVHTSGDTSGTPIDILAHDMETGEESRMSDDVGVVSWSPDGKEIVVSRPPRRHMASQRRRLATAADPGNRRGVRLVPRRQVVRDRVESRLVPASRRPNLPDARTERSNCG